MRLEPFYRVTFTTPESWSVTREGGSGAEGQSFLIAEGRASGRLSARYRAANFPRRRVDGALEPEFRGALETDDGATILFLAHGGAFIAPALGGAARPLIPVVTGSRIRTAAWSPDGAQIAFARADSLYEFTLAGGAVRGVGAGRLLHSCAWSPTATAVPAS